MRDDNIDHAPDLTFIQEFAVDGEIRAGGTAYPPGVLRVTRPLYRHPSDLTFAFQYPKHDARMYYDMLASNSTVEFVGHLRFDGPGELVDPPDARLDLRWSGNWQSRVTGTVEQMDVGVVTLPGVPDEQIVVASLTPTDLAFPVNGLLLRMRDGVEVPYRKLPARDPFTLPTALGTFNLMLGYERHTARIGTHPVEVTVPEVSLSCTLADGARSADLAALLQSVQVTLADVERVLTLLSRRHVRVHHVHLLSVDRTYETPAQESDRYQRGHSTPPPTHALLDPEAVPPDGIGRALTAFRASAYRETLAHVATHLTAYWNAPVAESEATAAFTALETLVNGIAKARGEEYTVDDATYKALAKAIKRSIKDVAEQVGLAPDVRQQLYEKVVEVKRPALAGRVAALVLEHGVTWRDLWPTTGAATGAPADSAAEAPTKAATGAKQGEPAAQHEPVQDEPVQVAAEEKTAEQTEAEEKALAKVVGDAYKRRSALIHQGQVADYHALLDDAARIHALTERVVMRLLDVEQDWLAFDAYWYVPRPVSPSTSPSAAGGTEGTEASIEGAPAPPSEAPPAASDGGVGQTTGPA